MIIHKREHTDDENEIVPDGGIVRVSIMAMDSTQKQIAALDERVQHNIKANQATLKAMQRDADRAQGFADHFTAQRVAQADHSEYGKYCARLENAHREAV